MIDPNDPLLLHKYAFSGFSPDHDQADARRIFTERQGYPPQVVRLEDGLLWVGPVVSEETRGPEQLRLC